MWYRVLSLCGAALALTFLALTSPAAAQDRGRSDRGSSSRSAADQTAPPARASTYQARIVRVEPERRMFVVEDLRPEGGPGPGTGTGAGNRGTSTGGTGPGTATGSTSPGGAGTGTGPGTGTGVGIGGAGPAGGTIDTRTIIQVADGAAITLDGRRTDLRALRGGLLVRVHVPSAAGGAETTITAGPGRGAQTGTGTLGPGSRVPGGGTGTGRGGLGAGAGSPGTGSVTGAAILGSRVLTADKVEAFTRAPGPGTGGSRGAGTGPEKR